MSRGHSAFNFVGASNGQSIFKLRQSEVLDTKSLSSSKQSSIPELSRAEELAIKRSSSSFSPIGQIDDIGSSSSFGEGASVKVNTKTDAEDLMDNWRPSDELVREIDRATGPRRLSGWDDEGLEVTQHTLNPVDLIPTHVRGSTPDSVASSGKVMLRKSHGEQKVLDAGNLQDNVEQRMNNHIHNNARSMRDYLKEDSIDDEQPSTSTATGNNIRMYNLAKSTRDHVQAVSTDDEQPSTSIATGNNNERRQKHDDTDGLSAISLNFQVKPEENRYFLPKCLLLLLAVMIALAVVVAIVVIFKDDERVGRGEVIPDPIIHYECKSKEFSLGDKINFTCTFDAKHDYRMNITNATKVKLEPLSRNRSSRDDSYNMTVISGNGTSSHEILIESNLTAKCSSAGTYFVEFHAERNRISTIVANNPKPNVTFTIKASTVMTTMTQRQLKGINCLETMFDLTCSINNDCNNYDATVYKNKFGRVENLKSYLKCKRNFTDDNGYTMDCSASLPDKYVESYSFIACKMERKLSDGQVLRREQRYQLPSCGVESRCHTREPGYAVFNCSEKAQDYQKLLNADCDFPKQTNCLKPGRQVFSMQKDIFDNLTCSGDNVVPVCRLSWCSDYSFIVKNEIPGVAICSPSFNERYVSPTTTTTLIPPTT